LTTELESLVFGVVLGFTLAAPPGPMNAWIAAAASRSYRAGVVTGLGAMTADALLGTVVYVLDRGLDLLPVVRFVYLVGAAVMAYLGVRLLRDREERSVDLPLERTFARAILVGLANPFQVVWWLTAGVAFAYLGGLVLLLGLFGAIAVWVLAFPWAVHVGARRDQRVRRGVLWLSGALLLAFAAYFVALFAVG